MKILFCSICGILLITCNNINTVSTIDNPSPPKSPSQELASFQLQDKNLKIELVAAEPMVEDPVAALFDEKGRMWVVEMRGFMNDVNKAGEDQKIGRVSILEDENADGVMDKTIVFADSLIMPRTLALVPGGALIAENRALWFYQDRDNDSRSDYKKLIDSQYAKNGLPEHSDNGMWRNIDNYYYNAKSTFRYKLDNDVWKRDSTEFRGQWGIHHDEEGRLIYNYNWSQLHGDLVPPNSLSRNKNHRPTMGIDYGYTLERRLYPIRPTPAVNRGYIPGTLDSNGRILEFTAACSPFMYKERLLPDTYYGNVFVCEPSGNLIKRNKTQNNGVLISANDPNPGKEFLASTDERFRPVNFCTGPDGALYVIDMYRGLIQHGAYVTPYLKEQTLSRKLELPVHMGRIWRISPINSKYKKPELSNDWVDYLFNQNAWYRDLGQKKLVESHDYQAIDKIKEKIKSTDFTLGRFQAMWTLNGLQHLDTTFLVELLKDKEVLIQKTALRHLEPILVNDLKIQDTVSKYLSSIVQDIPIEMALQTALSAYALGNNKLNILTKLASRFIEQPLVRDAILSSIYQSEYKLLTILLEKSEWKMTSPGREIFIELLISAILKNGNALEIKNIIQWIDTTSNKWWQTASINGLFSMAGSKIVKLNAKPRFFDSLEHTKNNLLATVFDWPGNTQMINTSDKKKNSLQGNDLKAWAAGRQHYLNSCAGCHGTDGKGIARFAPTLVESDWVNGDKRRLALLVLHGIEGPIEVKGKLYDKPEILPVMPSHSTLSDADIADILTYIRNEWGNNAGPMDRRTVGMTRVLAQGRVIPWTVPELNNYIQATDTSKKIVPTSIPK